MLSLVCGSRSSCLRLSTRHLDLHLDTDSQKS
jgi:hypothetical protein